MSGLLELAARCESAPGASKALDREIALAVGWVRLSPSEARRKNPAWYHPDDCRNGKPIIDSLHGADVWREPSAYTASIDAAMTLVPEGFYRSLGQGDGPAWASVGGNDDEYVAEGATPALALTAAALRARAVQS